MIPPRVLLRSALWAIPVLIIVGALALRGGRQFAGQAGRQDEVGFCCLDGANACQPSTFDACVSNPNFEAFDTSQDICNAQCGGGTVYYCQNRDQVKAGQATPVCSPAPVQGGYAFVGQSVCESACSANACDDCDGCNGAAGFEINCSRQFCEMNSSCVWSAATSACGKQAALCGGAVSSASSSADACSGGSKALPMCEWVSDMMGGDPKITGPDGNTWVSHGQSLLKWPPGGPINYDYLPYQATDFALGSDGNVWFTDGRHNSIGRIDENSVITLFPIPTVAHDGTSYPWHLTLGPDGNIWFTELWAGRIGKITPSGVITEYYIPAPDWPYITANNIAPSGIIGGNGCELWFTAGAYRHYIGKITVDGVPTLYTIPEGNISIVPVDINLDANGDVLFTQNIGTNRWKVLKFFPATGTFDLVGTEMTTFASACPGSGSSSSATVSNVCSPGLLPCSEISCQPSACGDTPVSDGRGMCRCGASCATCPEDRTCVENAGDIDPFCAVGSSSSARSSSISRSSSASSVAVVCGNGLIQAQEACDDGNVTDGDGCSRLCVIEDGFLCNP